MLKSRSAKLKGKYVLKFIAWFLPLVVAISALYLNQQSRQPSIFNIQETYSLDIPEVFSSFGNDFLNKNIQISLQSKTYPSIRLSSYRLSNFGKTVIRPEDFVDTLSVTTDPPFVISAVTHDAFHTDKFETKWRRLTDQKWEMEPCLFNGGDESSITIVIVCEKIKNSHSSTQPITIPKANLKFNGRIANVPVIRTGIFKRDQETLPYVYLPFGHVLGFLALVTAMFFLTVVFVQQIGKRPLLNMRQSPILLLMMLLSMMSSEIMITFVFPPPYGNIYFPFSGQWKFSIGLILLHLVFIMALLFVSRSKYLLSPENRRQSHNCKDIT